MAGPYGRYDYCCRNESIEEVDPELKALLDSAFNPKR